tara:strand:+ start:6114 stop:9017 length:2904 start_codon:yes stop_codon:yes gene_type:complete
MLRLNHELFTSDRIIAWFEENLTRLEMPPTVACKPSNLRQLKTRLRGIFFEGMDKTASDEDVLAELNIDARFALSYPKLKEVLGIIFSLNDGSNQAKALMQLKNIEHMDWDTQGIRAKFDELNTKFGYFNPPSEHLHNLFSEMAISCRTMAVLFEKNNTPEDTMAYNYAYKIMALFIDPAHPEKSTLDSLAKNTYKLTNNIDNDRQHPFHEALLVQLEPLPHAKTVKDREGWRALIQTHGVKALPFFLMAEQIEEKIATQPGERRRAPKHDDNLAEAKRMFALCSYKRAAEDPEFAQLCKHHKASEAMFDAGLDYLAEPPGWPKKIKDNLPDLTIQGEGEAEGLYWVKLPFTDKRALILGQITDCCQSIAGHSEQCVKDAVSLHDNGLYVLVKQKKKGNPALIESGQINEQDFKIIGQSYVWISMLGNVCLDSLECLSGEVSNGALHVIMAQFGEAALKQHPDANCVTLGCGGKTPENLFKVTPIPELMRQGIQYGDSFSQYRIAETPRHLSEEHDKIVNKIFKGYPTDVIDYLKMYVKQDDSDRLVDTLHTLFYSGLRRLVSQTWVTAHKKPEGLLIALLIMHQAGLLSGAGALGHYRAVLKHQKPEYLVSALNILSQAGLLSGEQGQVNCQAVLKHLYLGSVALALSTLNQANLLSGEQGQANCQAVLEHHNSDRAASALSTLSQAGLLSGEQGQVNRQAVLKHHDPDGAASALSTLSQAGLLSGVQGPANRQAVLKHNHPSGVASALSTLSHAGLLIGEQGRVNSQAVLKHHDPERAASALSTLSYAGLLIGEQQGQANCQAVLKHYDPDGAASVLSIMSQAGLLTTEQGQANSNLVRFFMDIFMEMKLNKLLLKRVFSYKNTLVHSINEVINNIHTKQIPLDDELQIRMEILNYFKTLSEDKNSEIGRALQHRNHPRLDGFFSPIIKIEPRKFTDFKDKYKELALKEEGDEEPTLQEPCVFKK